MLNLYTLLCNLITLFNLYSLDDCLPFTLQHRRQRRLRPTPSPSPTPTPTNIVTSGTPTLSPIEAPTTQSPTQSPKHSPTDYPTKQSATQSPTGPRQYNHRRSRRRSHWSNPRQRSHRRSRRPNLRQHRHRQHGIFDRHRRQHRLRPTSSTYEAAHSIHTSGIYKCGSVVLPAQLDDFCSSASVSSHDYPALLDGFVLRIIGALP